MGRRIRNGWYDLGDRVYDLGDNAMTTCAGCKQPLEHIAQIRVYHTQCDPQGRVEYLEEAIRAFVTLWDMDKRVMGDLVRQLREALAYRPAQMKGREE